MEDLKDRIGKSSNGWPEGFESPYRPGDTLNNVPLWLLPFAMIGTFLMCMAAPSLLALAVYFVIQLF